MKTKVHNYKQLIFIILILNSAIALAGTEKQGDCLLVVKAKTYIKGACTIFTEADGSFSLGPVKTEALSYTASVNMRGKNTAEGFWHEESPDKHLKNTLGKLQRKGDCWQNASSKICVRELKSLNQAVAATLRCGWFENPGEDSAWLNDKDGRWLISAQNGFKAEGEWPVFKATEWVSTKRRFGYGCSCLEVITDDQAHSIKKIVSTKVQALKACFHDRALKRPAKDQMIYQNYE